MRSLVSKPLSVAQVAIGVIPQLSEIGIFIGSGVSSWPEEQLAVIQTANAAKIS